MRATANVVPSQLFKTRVKLINKSDLRHIRLKFLQLLELALNTLPYAIRVLYCMIYDGKGEIANIETKSGERPRRKSLQGQSKEF